MSAKSGWNARPSRPPSPAGSIWPAKSRNGVASTCPLARSRILIAPVFSTMNSRETSPGGLPANSGCGERTRDAGRRDRADLGLRPVRVEAVDQIVAAAAAQRVGAVIADEQSDVRHRAPPVANCLRHAQRPKRCKCGRPPPRSLKRADAAFTFARRVEIESMTRVGGASGHCTGAGRSDPNTASRPGSEATVSVAPNSTETPNAASAGTP